MRKIISIAACLALIASLAACGSTSATTDTQTSTATAAPAAAEATETPASESAAAESEEDTVYNIGICQLMQHVALDAATQGFMDELTELLGADHVNFDLQNAQGDSTTCSTIVTGFVSNSYDLIMANATPALQAAVAATSTIPILGVSVTDYATALNDPDMDASKGTGINVSGVSDGVNAQLYADLLMELVPDAKNVSILYCSAEANSVVQSENFMKAMEQYGVTCTEYTFSDSNDMQAVCTSAIENCDAMYIPTDNTAASNMTIVSNVCEPAGIPIICGEEGMCSAGGLATCSISYYEIGQLCGEMAYDVLVSGTDISTFPIGYAENPVKEYNADYAAAIGFEMPEGYTAIEG